MDYKLINAVGWKPLHFRDPSVFWLNSLSLQLAKMNTQKLAQLQKMSNSVRTGGKGSVRRKKKVRICWSGCIECFLTFFQVVRHAAGNDTNLQATLKRSNLQPLSVDEVNLFRDDGKVLQFVSPKMQVNPSANTYVVSGKPELKDASAVQTMDMAAIHRMIADMKAQGTLPTGGKDDDIPDVEGDFDTTAKNAPKVEEVKLD